MLYLKSFFEIIHLVPLLGIVGKSAEYLKAVDQFVEIFFVNDADIGARIELLYEPHLFVLLRNITLIHRCKFKIEIEFRQIEVRGNGHGDIALGIPFNRECLWLVEPLDVIHAEDPGKFLFGLVLECGCTCLMVDRFCVCVGFSEPYLNIVFPGEFHDRINAFVDTESVSVENKIKLFTSLQGLRSYGAMTGTDRSFESLLELLAFGRENRWKFSVSITVTKENRNEICDMFAAAAISGAEVIQLGAMMPEGRGREHLELALSRSEWENVKEEIRSMKNCGVPYSFCDEMLCECRRQPEELKKKFGDPDFKPCPAGNEFGVIGPDGTYRKCLHFWNR